MLISASLPRFMSRKFLYRRSAPAVIVILGLVFILALVFVMAPPGAVSQSGPQLKRPQQTTPEKLPEETKPKKKVKGPRAVGVLQLTKSGKATLIPVAILVDGKFYDASVYKADPVPMALEGGTVYEAEQAGDSLGLFTVNGALHSKTQGAPHPWVGAGSFFPKGTEAPKSTRKAEDVPVGMGSSGGSSSSSDERPRLTRGSTSTPTPASSPASAPGSSAPAAAGSSSGSSSGPSSSGSSEKPGTAASPGTSPPAGGSSAGKSSSQDASKPAAPAASDKTADQGAKQPAPAPGPAQAENYYRPTLRRGKPTEAAPQEQDDAAPADKKTGKPVSSGTVAVMVNPEPVQLMAAISDGGGPDPRPYQFYWKPGEEDERRNQMLVLAGNEVQAYANALAKNRIPATPPAAAKTTAKVHKAPGKPVQPVIENIQFRTFDVWANSQPVMILSAEAHFPSTPGAAAAPEQYSITLVARTDIYGNLRKLYSGVTDKFHLDVTPKLELIDAVDADGDGRGELLFRETTDAGGGYVIYRASADKLSKMFDSLAE
jgi:hypothetical protein